MELHGRLWEHVPGREGRNLFATRHGADACLVLCGVQEPER
jgi:hypothetical protein